MPLPFPITVLTLFPQMFPGPLDFSVVGDAQRKNIWSLHVINIRSFALDKHHTVDDPGFGGGAGMVMRADVLDLAIQAAVQPYNRTPRFVYLSPRGTPFNQDICQQWVQESLDQDLLKPLILLCGRFEGVDQRILDFWGFQEISMGDFILAGGEIPAMALIEAYVRLLPGVLGNEESLQQETFAHSLLEYPHYTRPRIWNNLEVPPVLLSGNHQEIQEWRLKQAQNLTQSRRPDLWAVYTNSFHHPIKKGKGNEQTSAI